MQVVHISNLPGMNRSSYDEGHDYYDLPQQKQLVIHTDRLAVQGKPLSQPIPFKGVIFNQISLYWANKFPHLVGHNLVAQAMTRFPPAFHAHAAQLKGRSVIVQRLRELPLKFRVIGNVFGDDWLSYQKNRTVGGSSVPRGLKESARMERPVLSVIPTNSNVVEQGSPEAYKWGQRMLGNVLFKKIEDISLSIFAVARNYAAKRGILIADTVFEFGLHEGNPYLINDVLTPSTSTYWSAEGFEPGQPQPLMDRQPVLNWLSAQEWEPSQPCPPLPQPLLADISNRYRTIFNVMTGKIAQPPKEE